MVNDFTRFLVLATAINRPSATPSKIEIDEQARKLSHYKALQLLQQQDSENSAASSIENTLVAGICSETAETTSEIKLPDTKDDYESVNEAVNSATSSKQSSSSIENTLVDGNCSNTAVETSKTKLPVTGCHASPNQNTITQDHNQIIHARQDSVSNLDALFNSNSNSLLPMKARKLPKSLFTRPDKPKQPPVIKHDLQSVNETSNVATLFEQSTSEPYFKPLAGAVSLKKEPDRPLDSTVASSTVGQTFSYSFSTVDFDYKQASVKVTSNYTTNDLCMSSK